MRELERSRLSDLEQRLAIVVWPQLESASTALVLGIQEITSSGLVSVPAFLQLLAVEITHKGVTPSEAVKAAFYLSVSPDAIAGVAESLINRSNPDE